MDAVHGYCCARHILVVVMPSVNMRRDGRRTDIDCIFQVWGLFVLHWTIRNAAQFCPTGIAPACGGKGGQDTLGGFVFMGFAVHWMKFMCVL
jgi:hypothetical protein